MGLERPVARQLTKRSLDAGGLDAWPILGVGRQHDARHEFFVERPEADRQFGDLDRAVTPTHAGDVRAPGMLTEACFNKRPDARLQDKVTRCEFIVGSYYLFESLLCLDGRLDPVCV